MPSIRPNLALIAAIDRNHVIGRGNVMPWHLPEDLRRFRDLTMGAPILMGRKTHESIGRALPGRRNLVISRAAPAAAPNDSIERYSSLESALAAAPDAPRIFVIGGGEIYRQALPMASALQLTEIDAEFVGDTFFPQFDRAQWQETAREAHEQAAAPFLRYAFVTHLRRTPT